jgi:hypothetical protein
MVDLTAVAVVARAHLAAWRGQGRRLRERLARSRHVLTSAALVVAGLAGAPLGGLLVGPWFTGLILVAESCGAVWFGLMRDDGTGMPRRGERTPLQAARDHARGLP